MEELLASIRKAIHDDIGEVPASMSARTSGTLQRGNMRELNVKVAEEAASAAAEIQQLREKINRSRGSDTPVREPAAARSPGLAAALQAEAPRRNWRAPDLQPKLRSTIVEPTPAPVRTEPVTRLEPEALRMPEAPRYREPSYRAPEPRIAEPFRQPEPETSWTEEPPPPPQRETFRPRIESASPILSGEPAQAVQQAFNRLADTMLSRATGDRAIEDLARDLLRGMLKQWLDENLPALVERLVREEIERVARHGR